MWCWLKTWTCWRLHVLYIYSILVNHNCCLCPTDKPVHPFDVDGDRAPYKMIQTIGLSVGAAVAYIIVVLGLMFYCKKRRNAKRLQKGQDGEEPEMECLNGMNVWWREMFVNLWWGRQEVIWGVGIPFTTSWSSKRRWKVLDICCHLVFILGIAFNM